VLPSANTLRLVLNAEGYEYTDYFRNAGTGLRLFFHRADEHPVLWSESVRSSVVTAGSHVHVGVIQRTEVSALSTKNYDSTTCEKLNGSYSIFTYRCSTNTHSYHAERRTILPCLFWGNFRLDIYKIFINGSQSFIQPDSLPLVKLPYSPIRFNFSKTRGLYQLK
jgi:hypothetical protein